MKIYLLKDGDGDWYEVSKRQWVLAERMAGFHNTMGEPNEPATATWSVNKRGLNMAGKIEREAPLDDLKGAKDALG